jgi:ABC-type uncharacterized transport system permease subunit
MKIDLYYVMMGIAIVVFVAGFTVVPFYNTFNKIQNSKNEPEQRMVPKVRNLKKVKCVCEKGIFTYTADDPLVQWGFAKAGEKGPCGYCHGEGYLYEEEVR